MKIQIYNFDDEVFEIFIDDDFVYDCETMQQAKDWVWNFITGNWPKQYSVEIIKR